MSPLITSSFGMLHALASIGPIACGPCQYAGPTTTQTFADWISGLQADREATLAKINYRGGVFHRVQWTQSSFIQPRVHPFDRFFFDPESGNYTVQRYLADVKHRYGGIDAMLMWPTYPNIGIDDRNQFDFFRTMPGGLAGVKAVTQELKAAGVRVLWPYNPWDRGTRRETPDSDAHTLAMLLQRTGGDGFNGDTMFTIPETFWTAAAVDRQYPIALEPEDGGIDDGLNWHTLGWGYWDFQADVPIVDRFKFLTRGKFLTHACDRWAKNKTNNLHAAFFNGAGYEAWENVWGVWNGIVPRDGEAIRRMATMLRFLGSSAAGYVLRSPFWVPHTPEVAQRGVFASKWPAHQSLPPFPAPFAARIADLRSNATSHVAMRDEAQAGGNALLNAWTLVNRAGRDFDGSTVQLRVHAASETSRFFDCYAGREIAPLAHDDARLQKDEVAPNATTTRTLHFALEREGFGCVLELGGAPNSDVAAFLSSMAKLTRTPLSALPNAWTYLPQVLVPNGRTPHTATPPPGGPYVFIPYAPAFLFKVKSLQVEGRRCTWCGCAVPVGSTSAARARTHAIHRPLLDGSIPRDQPAILRVPQGDRLPAKGP